jgi:hypothetical protein
MHLESKTIFLSCSHKTSNINKPMFLFQFCAKLQVALDKCENLSDFFAVKEEFANGEEEELFSGQGVLCDKQMVAREKEFVELANQRSFLLNKDTMPKRKMTNGNVACKVAAKEEPANGSGACKVAAADELTNGRVALLKSQVVAAEKQLREKLDELADMEEEYTASQAKGAPTAELADAYAVCMQEIHRLIEEVRMLYFLMLLD